MAVIRRYLGNMAAAKLVETNVDYCQIRAEARLLHEFRHPNIVTLYAVFQGTAFRVL